MRDGARRHVVTDTGPGEGSPKPPDSDSGHQAPGNPSPARKAPEAVMGPGGAGS